MFHIINFLVTAETKEEAKTKLLYWIEGQVSETAALFAGASDQAYMVRSKREYWETGFRNSMTRELVVKPTTNYDYIIG